MSYIGNLPTNVAFVTDQFNGDGSTVAFTMSVAPATTSSILVAVTGVLQDPSTYSVSGTTLTFSAAPPSGTGNISVRYLGIPASGVTTTAYRTVTDFTATAGQTTFSPPSYTVGYIDVYRNGSKLGAADFTATNGTTVVLASGANAGDLVETVSMYVSSVLNAIPATAGAVQQTYIASGVAGTGPSFSAYQSSAQSLTNNTTAKIQFQTKEWDTASCFDSTTNYRFTPNVPGYYQFNGSAQYGGAGTYFCVVYIYKNGVFARSGQLINANASAYPTSQVSAMLYMNGTTDYVELYGFQFSGGTLNIQASATQTFFQGFLARAA